MVILSFFSAIGLYSNMSPFANDILLYMPFHQTHDLSHTFSNRSYKPP